MTIKELILGSVQRYNNRFAASLFFLGLLFFCQSQVNGQDNWNSMWAQPFIKQSDSLDYKLKISPINFNLDLSTSFVIKNIVDEIEDKKILNWNKVLNETKEVNGIFAQNSVEFLNTELVLKDWVLNAGFGARSEAYLELEEPIFELLIAGNTSLFEGTAKIAPQMNYNSWYQFMLGLRKHFDGAHVGLNFKLLDGVEHFNFSGFYRLTSSDIFDKITVNRNVLIQSTGLLDFRNLQSIDFKYSLPFTDGIGFDNIGFMIDIYGGLEYEKHQFNLNVSDLGMIKWNQAGRTKEYTSTGIVEYNGIELSDVFGQQFEFNLQDSLENILGIELTDTESYKSKILSKIQLRYQYNHSEDLSFGLHNFFALDGKYGYYRIGAFASKQLGDSFHIGLIFSTDSYSTFNLGLSTKLETKRFDVSFHTQNVLALFDPYGYNIANVAFATAVKF